MHVNISPLTWSRKVKELEPVGAKPSRGDQNYLFVDGISVYAHRLFGPLPKTTTYVANWKMDIGSIYGQIKPSFLLGVSSFAKAFIYNMKDGDNAFPPEYATVTPPDITFVEVRETDTARNPLIMAAGELLVKWLALLFLYRNRLFLRV